jgi:Protein involved in formate dehydrogenase formation
VRRRPRGGPGQFEARLARAGRLLARGNGAAAPLATLVEILHHQLRRATTPEVAAAADEVAAAATARRTLGRYPLFDLERSLPVLDAETMAAVAGVDGPWLPDRLNVSRAELQLRPATERIECIGAWLDDPDAVEPRFAFWFQAATGPSLELAAATVGAASSDGWQRSACPLCGGAAQASVIAEESGEFLGGSPRSLVCGRCATWWSYPRAVCPSCGEDDSRCVTPYVQPDDRLVRVDGCQTCHRYVKTFDLREPGADEVIPLVDDVATMALDLWARQRGFERASLSFAGV